jgi:aryl-alcohol dehydrogenase-like predicted oxidoreductase
MTDLPRAELAPGYSIAGIINGCWQLSPGHGGGPESKAETLRRFAELVEHGFTTFDCADIYTGTEELLGEFRRTLDDPDGIQVHTKFVPDKERLAQLDDQQVDAAINRSLAKLGVERLDLVQFHWWDYAVDGIERVYERLLHNQGAGKIRLLGVTNFNTDRLRTLVTESASIVSMQAQYSLVDRRPERQLLDYCAGTGIAVLPFGVLAGGCLSDRYLGSPPPDGHNRSLQKYRLIIDDAGGWDAFQRLLQTLSGIAAKHDTGIDRIAARWVLDQPAVAAIIVGVGRRSRATENHALGALALDDADRAQIAACLRNQPIPPGEPYDLERDANSVHSRIIRTNLLTDGST